MTKAIPIHRGSAGAAIRLCPKKSCQTVFLERVAMYEMLVPNDDWKQKLRTTRIIQALGEGVMQTFVSILLFIEGGFRLELTGFAILMISLWVGHLTLYLVIRLGLNQRFSDPSMTFVIINWSILTLLVTLFFMDRFRPLMILFFPVILIFGSFRMTPRQYMVSAAFMVLGYTGVIISHFKLYPHEVDPEYELLVGIVFVVITIAYSLVSNQISLLRRKLHERNAELATAMEKVELMAITDELTGLINRRHMMFMLKQQKGIADRGGNGFCVCYFDIDQFKRINDTLGHHVGDIVLQRFASTIQSQLRVSDILARFGGEEFVLMASSIGLNGATVAANRIRKSIEAIKFQDVAADLTVTVSGGVAQYKPNDQLESLLSRADKALYLAKKSGRNCIKIETDL
jgi:diguanylate cyclase (GGDEF)-like protein